MISSPFLWLCLSVFGKYSDIGQKYSDIFGKSMFFEYGRDSTQDGQAQ